MDLFFKETNHVALMKLCYVSRTTLYSVTLHNYIMLPELCSLSLHTNSYVTLC